MLFFKIFLWNKISARGLTFDERMARASIRFQNGVAVSKSYILRTPGRQMSFRNHKNQKLYRQFRLVRKLMLDFIRSNRFPIKSKKIEHQCTNKRFVFHVCNLILLFEPIRRLIYIVTC